jgi:hypothetical protein
VVDLLGEAVQATVSKTIRETVGAVAELLSHDATEVTVAALAEHLEIDKAAVSRRYRAAADLGHLLNREEKKGRPARIGLGEPLPEERQLLPTREELEGVLTWCAVDGGGKETPLSSAPPASVTEWF